MATLEVRPAYAQQAVIDLGLEEPFVFPCSNPENAVDNSAATFAEASAIDLGGRMCGLVLLFSPDQLQEFAKWNVTGIQLTVDSEIEFEYGDEGIAVMLPCSVDSETGVCTIADADMQPFAVFPEASALEEGESVTVSRRGQQAVVGQISTEYMNYAYQGYTAMIIAFLASSANIYDVKLTLIGNRKVNKVVFGSEEIIDLTGDTVSAEKLLQGYTAHDASGSIITGTAIQGTDTSDADATAADIASGRIAYVNGEKLTGTNTSNCDTSNDMVSPTALLQGYTAHDSNGQQISGSIAVGSSLSRTISSKDQTVTIPPAYYQSQVSVSIDEEEKEKIKAENIKDGISILGVTGSFSGGGNVVNGVKFLTVDNSGYPLTIELIGSLTPYECANTSATTGAYSKITAAYLPSGVTVIPSYLFRYCSKLAAVTGMDNVTAIETYAFHSCAELVLTSLPSGLTNIGSYAFYGCKKINPSIIKASTLISGNAFQNCTGMTDLTKVQSNNIYSNAFSGCSGLGPKLKIKALQIGSGPTSTNNAFKNCTGLRAVWIDASSIHASSSTYGPFYGCSNLTIYTPASEKPAGWGTYFNYLGTSSQANVVYNTTEAQFDALTV